MMKEFHSRENCWASGMDFPIAPSDTLQRLSTEWSMGFCADQGQLGLIFFTFQIFCPRIASNLGVVGVANWIIMRGVVWVTIRYYII